MPYIASTMATDVNYTRWQTHESGAHTPLGAVTIKGGHGVASRTPSGGLVTPNGVVTKVTDEELDFLKEEATFKLHLARGAVKVMQYDIAPEKVAKDMSQDDSSRPLVTKDFEKGGRAAVPEGMKINGGKDLQ